MGEREAYPSNQTGSVVLGISLRSRGLVFLMTRKDQHHIHFHTKHIVQLCSCFLQVLNHFYYYVNH